MSDQSTQPIVPRTREEIIQAIKELTPEQRKTLYWRSEGTTVEEISKTKFVNKNPEVEGISPQAVAGYMTKLFEKWGVKDEIPKQKDHFVKEVWGPVALEVIDENTYEVKEEVKNSRRASPFLITGVLVVIVIIGGLWHGGHSHTNPLNHPLQRLRQLYNQPLMPLPSLYQHLYQPLIRLYQILRLPLPLQKL